MLGAEHGGGRGSPVVGVRDDAGCGRANDCVWVIRQWEATWDVDGSVRPGGERPAHLVDRQVLVALHVLHADGGLLVIAVGLALFTASAITPEEACGRTILPLGKPVKATSIPRPTMPIFCDAGMPGVRIGQR